MIPRCVRVGLPLGLLLLAGGAGLFALGADPDTPPPLVTVVRPVERQVVEYADFTGRTEATESVELRARVTGYVTKIAYKAGTEVKRGDLMFEIDPRPYQAALDQAAANLRLAEAKVKRADATLARLKAIGPPAISREEVDHAEADRTEALAATDAARAGHELAKLNLAFTHVTSPIDGKAGMPLIGIGNLVSADTTALATVISAEPMYVYFDVDERTYLTLRRAAQSGRKDDARREVPVAVGLADEEGYPRKGVVDATDVRVDAATGTIRWRAVVPNPNRLMLPGMFVRARIPLGEPHKGLLVPERAVGREQGRPFVLVVGDKNVVASRAVKLGPVHGDMREVREGLTANERVVAKPGLVREGTTVRPELVEAERP
jgi:RND family efflux transporter MFP subunit